MPPAGVRSGSKVTALPGTGGVATPHPCPVASDGLRRWLELDRVEDGLELGLVGGCRGVIDARGSDDPLDGPSTMDTGAVAPGGPSREDPRKLARRLQHLERWHGLLRDGLPERCARAADRQLRPARQQGRRPELEQVQRGRAHAGLPVQRLDERRRSQQRGMRYRRRCHRIAARHPPRELGRVAAGQRRRLRPRPGDSGGRRVPASTCTSVTSVDLHGTFAARTGSATPAPDER